MNGTTNTSQGTVNPTRGRLRRALAGFGMTTALVLAQVHTAGNADAAAFAYGVYAPTRLSSYQIRGWANLSRDCSGTLGCYNYMKIERRRWYGPEYLAGWWANYNGWNNVTATLPYGCYDYRTTVDSYNDYAGTYGGGVNVGKVGVTWNGTSIYRFRTTWSSGWARHCR